MYFGKYGCDPPMDNPFSKRGWSVFEDNAEIRNVKYSWLRAGDSFSGFDCGCSDELRNQRRSCPDLH